VGQSDSVNYFHTLLNKALLETSKDYGSYELQSIRFKSPQRRTLKLLNDYGVLDVTWSVTSKERESEYIAVKVPLLNGLFGKRRLMVKQERKAEFEVMTEAKLKTMTACQGLHWPDFTRLKNNGYKVYGVVSYESNIKMLAKDRCDYFPRGAHEIEPELAKLNDKYEQIVAVDSVMLEYEAPVYFFVGKHNQALANRIEQGLLQLKADGQLTDLLHHSNAFHYDHAIDNKAKVKIYRLEKE